MMKMISNLSLALGASVMIFTGCSGKSVEPADPMKMPTQEQMTKMMIEAGTPAAEHKLLAPTLGTWKAVSRWRMSPDQPEEISTALAKKKLAMNGLFVEESYEDKNEKHPFSGRGIYGYDKVSGEFVSTWYDTMSSSIWSSKGKPQKEGKLIVYTGGGSCPFTGGYKEVRAELEIVNNNKHIYRMFDIGPDGEEFRGLEIVYERLNG